MRQKLTAERYLKVASSNLVGFTMVKIVLIPVNDEFELEVDSGQQAVSRRIGNHFEAKDCDYIVVVGEKEVEILKSVGRKIER